MNSSIGRPIVRGLLKLLFVVVSLAFMAWMLFAQWQEVSQLEWSLHPTMMFAAIAALVVLFFASAFGWHLILMAFGVHVDVRSNVRTWLLSSLGRYFPGGIWGYASRIAMGVNQGLSAATVGLALYLETLLLCAGAITAGLPALVLAVDVPIQLRSIVLIVLLLGILVHPRTLSLFRYVPGRIGRAFAITKMPCAAAIFSLYFYYVLYWVVFGFVFVIFVEALHPVPPGSALLIGASMALGFAAGLLAVFSPGGIGVREAVLYFLLLPVLPAPTSLLISVGSRLWIMTGEAVSVALALFLLRTRAKR